MPISQSEMTAEQIAAVAQALVDALTEDPDYRTPILSGEVRHSRSGAPWVRFPPNTIWFRLMDIPPNPPALYKGARYVISPDGKPLGNNVGPLVIHEINGKWLAQTINTGWNIEHEIIWTETA